MTSSIPKKRDVKDISIFYKPDTIYEITINPDDEKQFLFENVQRRNKILSVRERTNRFLKYWCKYLEKSMRNTCDYSLYIEVDEKRKLLKGEFNRLHFHGIIKDLDVYSFLTYSMPMLAKCSVIQINSYEKEYWNKYITKQDKIVYPKVKNQLTKYPLVKDTLFLDEVELLIMKKAKRIKKKANKKKVV